jgi:hypothetical protein
MMIMSLARIRLEIHEALSELLQVIGPHAESWIRLEGRDIWDEEWEIMGECELDRRTATIV